MQGCKQDYDQTQPAEMIYKYRIVTENLRLYGYIYHSTTVSAVVPHISKCNLRYGTCQSFMMFTTLSPIQGQIPDGK